MGVSAILLSCSYCFADQPPKEFIRVGYYVSVNYDSEELVENPPETPAYDRLLRHILDDQPRVTRFLIDWTGSNPTGGEQPQEIETTGFVAPNVCVAATNEEGEAMATD